MIEYFTNSPTQTWPCLHRRALRLALTVILALTWTAVVYAAGPGDLDTTFNGTGVVTTEISSGRDESFDVAVQPDGKIVVAGVSDNFGVPSLDFAVVRYEADGQLDLTFNSTGIVTTPVNTEGGGVTALAIQPDGKIVAAGISSGSSGAAFTVVRYDPDGDLDLTFNSTGVVTTVINDDLNQAFDMALQPDGKIVVVGEAGSGPDTDFAVVRYMPQGALDSTFNSSGMVTTTIGSVPSSALAVNIQSDGKIVAAGFGAIVRYHTDGTLDTSFNGTGVVTTSQILILDATLQPDGKIVVVGQSGDSNQSFFTTARYDPGGQLDTTFNGTGVVTTSVTGHGHATSVTIQPNGKLVVAGQTPTNNFNFYEAAVVRYRSNGELDTTLNGTGVVTTTIGSSFNFAVSVTLQADGKILVSGASPSQDFTGDFAVVRYLGDHFLFLPVILK